MHVRWRVAQDPGKGVLTALICAAVVACGAPSAVAGEVGDPAEARLAELERQLLAMRAELDALRAAGATQDKGGTEKPKAGDDLQFVISGAKLRIGGQYRVMFMDSNHGWHPATISSRQNGGGFANQRFRTWFDLEVNDRVGAYMQLEVGHILWGTGGDGPKTYGADNVGIEFRRGFLSYDCPFGGEVRVGIQDYSDKFWDTLASSDWDFNVAGVSWTSPADLLPVEARLGFFTLWDAVAGAASDDVYLMGADVDFKGVEGLSLGVSAYYIRDRGQYSYGLFGGPLAPYHWSWDAWLGVRGSYDVTEQVKVAAFFIMNSGRAHRSLTNLDWRHTGYAAAARSEVDTSVGTVHALFAWSSGEDNPLDNSSSEFRTVAQSVGDNFGAQGYWSHGTVSSPRGPSDVNDLGIGLQNRGLGLVTVQVAYEIGLSEIMAEQATDWLKAYVAFAWFRSDKRSPLGDDRDMGIELVGELRFDLGGGLIVEPGVGYFVTGDFYENPTALTGSPDALYQIYMRVQLEF